MLLFFAAWAVYNLNCRPITSGDTIPAALLPLRVVLDGTLTFDRYADGLARLYNGGAYFLHRENGHFYSRYPIAIPLLLTPAYAPLRLVPGIRDWPLPRLLVLARVFEKIWASLIAAASVTFLFLLLRRLTEANYAVLLALIFGFATSTWSISSQALWQHGMSQLTIILSLLFVERFLESGSWRSCAGAGLVAALSVAVRPTNVLFFVISSLVLLVFTKDRRKVFMCYSAFGGFCGCALALYNLWLFGSLGGGYADEPLGGALLAGLLGLSFSPSHGFFLYSPILLFGFAGIFSRFRSAPGRSKAVFLISLGFFFSLLALYANYALWWGGACYGPRYMTDAIPAMVLLLVPVLPYLRRSRLVKAAFAGALAFSFAVQVVGAFSYPLGERPGQALWDWKHNPIVRNASAGLYLHGYRVLWDYAHGRHPDFRKYGLRIE